MTSRAHRRHARQCLLLLLLLGFLGCADFERGKASPSVDAGTRVDAAGDGGDSAAPSFATDVYPLLIGGCMGCHANGGNAGRTALVLLGNMADDYEASLALVDTANPAQSRLLTKSAGQAHAGGAIYAETSDEYATMLAWIASGAQP